MRLQGFFCFLALCSYPALAALPDSIKAEKITEAAQSQKWQRLLHYKKTWYGALRSEADGKDFFLSPEGKKDPRAELVANLEMLLSPTGPIDPKIEPLACRFPARRRFFLKTFPELATQFQNPPCPDYWAFRNSIGAAGVSFVFSSYYLNNPSSSFGHTFLRFQRTADIKTSDRAELLDMGMNYGANPTTKNPIIYGVFGFIGMFEGTFSKLPYYYKVREYADFEARDLWTYELNLTQEQTNELVDHLWELGHTYFDYYFLSENCSYHLLGVLELVLPEADLTGQTSFYVIPSESLKIITRQQGLVKAVHFRPSNRRIFQNSFSKLNSEERDDFFKITEAKDPVGLKVTSDQSKMKVLDAAMDYLDFRMAKDIGYGNTEASQIKQKFLVARSAVPLQSDALAIPTPEHEQPHIGHNVKKFSIGGGTSSRSYGFAEAKFRFAFHNKLDYLPGYPPSTTSEVFDFHVRYESLYRKVSLRDFSALRLENYQPINNYTYPLSWTVKVGLERATEKDHCKKGKDCLVGMLRAGGGTTFEPFWKTNVYLIPLTELTAGPGLNKSWVRLGIGPMVGIYRPLFKYWSFDLHYKLLYYPFMDNNWTFKVGSEVRFAMNKNLELYLSFDRSELAKDTALGLQYSF